MNEMLNVLMQFWWIIPAYIVFGIVLWAITWLTYLSGWTIMRAGPNAVGWQAKLVQKLGPIMSTSLNWFVFTIILLEFPKETFLSARLARHFRRGHGWRQKVAGWMGRNWLDPYNPAGFHI